MKKNMFMNREKKKQYEFLFSIYVFIFNCTGDVDSLSAENAGDTISHCDCLICLLISAAMLLYRIANCHQLTVIKTWCVTAERESEE